MVRTADASIVERGGAVFFLCRFGLSRSLATIRVGEAMPPFSVSPPPSRSSVYTPELGSLSWLALLRAYVGAPNSESYDSSVLPCAEGAPSSGS